MKCPVGRDNNNNLHQIEQFEKRNRTLSTFIKRLKLFFYRQTLYFKEEEMKYHVICVMVIKGVAHSFHTLAEIGSDRNAITGGDRTRDQEKDIRHMRRFCREIHPKQLVPCK